MDPPSTGKEIPWICLASSDTRNKMALATSSVDASVLLAASLAHNLLPSAISNQKAVASAANIGVSTAPGQTALIRILSFA